ncbi:MAG: hypothetical protein ACI379_06045 [Nocardioides sp.]
MANAVGLVGLVLIQLVEVRWALIPLALGADLFYAAGCLSHARSTRR